MIIDGKSMTSKIEEEVKSRLAKLTEERGRAPRLALICSGEEEEMYVRNIAKACERVGIEALPHVFSADAAEKEITNYIKVLNADRGTDAIFAYRQRPANEKIIGAIDPRKDAYGYFSASRANVPTAILEILERSWVNAEGKHAVIINRNKYLGVPLARLLLNKGATVTVCHTKTFDLSWHTGQADILITAAGNPGLVTADMVKNGAVVIDAGMSRVGDQWKGDVDFDAVKDKAEAITPVPGGVGPVAIAMILKNVADIFGSNR